MFDDGKCSAAELAHFGVKGMKWGVHKKEEPTGDGHHGASKSDLKKVYASLPPEPTKSHHEAVKSLTQNHKKFEDKFEADGDHGATAEKHGLSAGQKKAIKVGVAIAIVGGLMVYGNHVSAKQMEEFKSLAGKEVHNDKFQEMVSHSKLKTWGFTGYIQESSHARAEFELPAGHTFHRISKHVETDFSGGTYATHSVEDFHRYVAAFRHEKGPGAELHHITFTAKEPIKIPALATVLDTVREHLSEVNGSEATPQQAASYYQSISGGNWSSADGQRIAKRLTAKGYHGIVDEMDAGVIGESPLVLFAKDLFSAKVAKPLTEDAIKAAESSLVELTNRKL